MLIVSLCKDTRLFPTLGLTRSRGGKTQTTSAVNVWTVEEGTYPGGSLFDLPTNATTSISTNPIDNVVLL